MGYKLRGIKGGTGRDAETGRHLTQQKTTPKISLLHQNISCELWLSLHSILFEVNT